MTAKFLEEGYRQLLEGRCVLERRAMSEKEIHFILNIKTIRYVTWSADKYRSVVHVIVKFYVIVHEIANVENIVAWIHQRKEKS